MTAFDEGIKQVDVRDLWPSEPYKFTPWLAENLELLGEAVGLRLEVVQQEKPIGSMFLDILAKEAGSGTPVAIENQLEWSDTDHMGRLLIYAAGCEAKVVIWVATEFMYEHAQVLDQLNEWAGSNASFYGVKVEAIKKGDDSSTEARLLKVVWPGGWDKALTLDPVPPPPPEVQQCEEFFRPLIVKMLGTEPRFADSYGNAWWHRDRFFPSGFHKDIGYVASFQSRAACVYLLLRTWSSVDLNNSLFDALKKDQEQFQSAIDPKANWFWNRHSGHTFSTIGIQTSASINDSPDKLEETRAWMIEMLPKFKEVFEERVERLLAELRTQPEDGADQP